MAWLWHTLMQLWNECYCCRRLVGNAFCPLTFKQFILLKQTGMTLVFSYAPDIAELCGDLPKASPTGPLGHLAHCCVPGV